MRYGFIIGDKPISNKKSDNRDTKGNSNSALIEYKEDEPVVIGKAADGRVMKQVSVTVKGYGHTGYVLRTISQDPNALLDSFKILSITGSIKAFVNGTYRYVPLTSSLKVLDTSDELSDSDTSNVLSDLFNWYFKYMSFTDIQKKTWLSRPIYDKIRLVPRVINRNVYLDLSLSASFNTDIMEAKEVAYRDKKITTEQYGILTGQVFKMLSDESAPTVHLTVTYLVKE